MTASDWTTAFREIDQLIKAAKLLDARTALTRLLREQVPRPLKGTAAELARRVDLPKLSLQILFRHVRGGRHGAPDATAAETVEYAAALIRVGAAEEALTLLNSVTVPRALLFTAFSHISHWDYARSIALLEKFVDAPSVTEYEHLIGLFNLASSLAFVDRVDESEKIIKELVERAGTSKQGQQYAFLASAVQEQRAQNAINSKNWSLARSLLDSSHVKGAETREALFYKKWIAIANWLEKRDRKSNLALRSVRAEASRLQHWETVRQIDLYELKLTQKKPLFMRLYYGTPYPAFRDRILSFAPNIPIAEVYPYVLGPRGGPVLELLTGRVVPSGKQVLKPSRLVHRLVNALVRDFYRPIRVASLHALLYPDEYFDPAHSAVRVHFALNEARHCFRKARFPLIVNSAGSGFRLSSRSGVVLQLRSPESPFDTSGMHPSLCILKDRLPRPFSIKEASLALGISERSVLRVLSEGIAQSQVERFGKGSATRYRFVDNQNQIRRQVG